MLALAVCLAILPITSDAQSDPILQSDPLKEAQALSRQGRELTKQGRFQEAEAIDLKGMALCEGPLNNQAYCVAAFSTLLGEIKFNQGHLAEAEKLFRRALTARLQSAPADSPIVAEAQVTTSAPPCWKKTWWPPPGWASA